MKNNQQFQYEERQKREAASAINVAQIVKVIAYNATKQTVNVQPLVKRLENGTYQSQPPVLDVPIVCDLCNKYGKKVEYKAGDVGLIVFCDTDIDNAISTGSEGNPNTERNHSATDAVFIGGIRSGSKKDVLPEGYAIGKNDGSIYLVVTDTGLEILGDTRIEGNVTIKGNVSVTGNITATGDIVAGGISLKNHTHLSAVPGSATTLPI